MLQDYGTHNFITYIKHLANHNVIIAEQHGFRAKMSCETQLIQAMHDWSEVLNRRGQADVLLLDFSKAFDKVPHHRLSIKLDYYMGIISSFCNARLINPLGSLGAAV